MVPLVMCVDDDSLLQILSEIILTDNAFCNKIVKAIDGKMALDYFKNQLLLPVQEQQIPALIFLDINMPIMDGWAFLREFEKDYTSIHHLVKVIMLSSSENPIDIKQAKENSLVIDFIPKPLDPAHLQLLKKSQWFSNYF
jgi:CheY-like chemotaxis protein